MQRIFSVIEKLVWHQLKDTLKQMFFWSLSVTAVTNVNEVQQVVQLKCLFSVLCSTFVLHVLNQCQIN